MVQKNQKKNIPCGTSFPKELIETIDKERGDIPRSRFIFRLIEQGLSKDNAIHNNDIGVTRKNESVDQDLEHQSQQITSIRGPG